MEYARKPNDSREIEKCLREYLKEGRSKLEKDLSGTREAIKLVAQSKTKEFMEAMDRGLTPEEREFLDLIIISGMYQSFTYGYGIGRIEGSAKNTIYL